MAILKNIESVSLILKMENGTNSEGETIYKTKSFNGIRTDATTENIYAVGKAISEVLAKTTMFYTIKENSDLSEN